VFACPYLLKVELSSWPGQSVERLSHGCGERDAGRQGLFAAGEGVEQHGRGVGESACGQVSVRQVGVDADGEIDVFTCGPLRDRLLALVDEGHSGLVVNLGRVSFIDSAGLGVLVAVWHRLCPFDGVLALAAPSPRVRGVLDTTGLTKAVSIYESTAEAVQACRPAR
jgi:anti-sigma B factor antagonist